MLISLLLPPLAALTSAHPQDDIQPVYIEHCAKCHGETGDGDGTADLERPARSFLDGGYSYGNTPGAIQRSIRHGIPGTAMPAFKETLSSDEIEQLAEFVASLGPDGTVVEPGSSILSVKDRPLCVRGMMPAAGEGGQRTPRSLVVGFPNGTTFHYDATSCELHAMFVGDFLDRRDWMDRGGAALRPLGTEVLRTDDAARSAAEIRSGDAVLTRAVARTHAAKDSVRIDFDLANAEGEVVGGRPGVLELPRCRRCSRRPTRCTRRRETWRIGFFPKPRRRAGRHPRRDVGRGSHRPCRPRSRGCLRARRRGFPGNSNVHLRRGLDRRARVRRREFAHHGGKLRC